MKSHITQYSRVSLASVLGVALIGLVFAGSLTAQAAGITAASDVVESHTISEATNHTITFTTPTGVAAGETITLTFESDYGLGTITEDDVDISDDATDIDTAAAAAGATWGVGVAGQVITFTSATGTIAGGSVVEIQIGDNATHDGTGANQITNPTAASPANTNYMIEVGGTFADSGTIVVPILADDDVNVTAVVAPFLSFALSTTSVDFGTLTTANARCATAGAGSGGDDEGTGTAGCSDNTAHTASVSTNATSGYTVSYNAPTLTFGAADITASGAIAGDTDGTPGNEQFGMGLSINTGTPTLTASYDYTFGTDNWDFTASTTTPIFSFNAPTASDIVNFHYIANIAPLTEAGVYETDIDFRIAGNF